MTGHYKKKIFNVKFDLDLGIIRAKIIISFLIFKETVFTVPSGFDRTAKVFSVQ